jgi:protein ImuB
MWIAVRFPFLPLEIFLRGPSTPEPFAVEERHAILVCDRKATARGVHAGMAASAALALVPNLRVVARDPAAETEALLGVAGWAAQFTPGVALEFPATMLLEVAGSLKLFHGLAALREKLHRGAAEMGYNALVSGAPTPCAASWLAAAGEETFVAEPARLGLALGPLPLAVLDLEKEARESLEGMGIRTLGELGALPREGLARRFGPAPLDALDRALGRDPDPRNFFVLPPKFCASIELPAEVTQADALLFAARRLLVQLAGFLAARSGGVQRFTLKLAHRDTAPANVSIGLVAPSRDAEHFVLLLRERLSAVSLAQPVRSITLEADDIVPLAGRNQPLLLEESKPPGQWEHLVERLRSRLGDDAVRAIGVRADHRPERAGVLADPGTTQIRLDFGERPVWILDPPRPLREIGAVPQHEGPLELLAGPERIESGWWDGDDVARDYFVARTVKNALVWIFCDRRGKGWYLHGVFA